jgi:spoIIIJ-associated protein
MSNLDTQVIAFVERVTSAMGLNLAVTAVETPDHIRLNLDGDDADALVQRKGEALDALQVIVNTAFRRDARGDRHYVVDALGSGEPQTIGPLNPYARRIVHLTVAEAADLGSASTGDEFLKTVVISRK